jgi:deazaflavin-dependent oxidoreductase (nitroreductase family)
MSITQRLGAVVVALFAVAFTRTPALIRALGPLMRRVVPTRLPAGPNVLLTVSGRNSGLPRTVPVSLLDVGDRCLLQAASADAGWVRNLRAAGEAVIASRGRSERLAAVELDPETAGGLLRELLEPFPRSRLVRAVVGPLDRPPVGVLYRFRIRVDDSLQQYVDLARRQPLFELRRPRGPES